jgi:hypothetical protein
MKPTIVEGQAIGKFTVLKRAGSVPQPRRTGKATWLSAFWVLCDGSHLLLRTSNSLRASIRSGLTLCPHCEHLALQRRAA